MTPHNEAAKGDYAEAVLLPGDPQRAEWIAQTFFDMPRQVNGIRGALGFTGTYKGMPVSVQTTGIGRPSLNIYVHELLAFYGVKTIVRVGSCGALDAGIGVRSLVIVSEAAMDFEIDKAEAWHRPDQKLFETAKRVAAASGVPHHVTPVVCSDTFYAPDPLGRFAAAQKQRGVLACDMENSAALKLASDFSARGLAICTVVDSLVTHEEIAHSERQAVFGPMAKLALDTLLVDRTAG